jgi:hypothetical protein
MEPDIWDLILLGRGSAIRYYLTTLDRSLFPNIIVIGKKDTWGGKRGSDLADKKSPVNFINQTADMLEDMDAPVPPFSRELVNRLTFSDRTRSLIDAYATEVVDDEVVDVDVSEKQHRVPKFIRASGRMRVYTVRVKGGDEYVGKKVVVATGAGDHREPQEVKGMTIQFPKNVMNMDTFGQQVGAIPNPEQKTVFIHGPNAAIDTADVAKYRKFNVVWLVKEKTEIPLLATNHQIYAKSAKDHDIKFYPDKGRSTPAFDVKVNLAALHPVTVTVGTEVIEGDLYVYGMGQDPQKAMEGVIPAKLRQKLVPVYDVNQRHGAVHETVLGFKLENSDWDNGFEVIGALCTQVARTGAVKHTYLKDLAPMIEKAREKVLQHMFCLTKQWQGKILFEELDKIAEKDCKICERQLSLARDASIRMFPTWKDQLTTLINLLGNYNVAAKFFAGKQNVADGDLDRVTKILTPSTVASAQLGGVRAATAAMNGFARSAANLGQDDSTILRFSIAVKYPFVSEDEAQRIIGEIIAGRRSAKLEGYGYTESQKFAFAQRLSDANTRGFQALTQPKHIGTGKTQPKYTVDTPTRVVI